MFGLFGGAIPVDKESVRVITAFRYLHDRKEDEIRALEKERDEKRPKGVITSEDKKKDDAIVKAYREKIDAETKKWIAKEMKLLRHVAGPLAKIVDGK